jgi:hypothetical protein
MFPHPDTVYAVRNQRLQDELKFAARQRLAATCRETTTIQPIRAAVGEGLARLAKRVRTPGTIAMPVAHLTNREAGQTEAAGAGLA